MSPSVRRGHRPFSPHQTLKHRPLTFHFRQPRTGRRAERYVGDSPALQAAQSVVSGPGERAECVPQAENIY